MQFDRQQFSTAVTTLQSKLLTSKTRFVDITGKSLLVGYWHNWKTSSGAGYQQGHAADLALTDIPADYNVVNVAFMRGAGIPTFEPATLSAAEFRRQVQVLNDRGQAVLLSLGGADAFIEVYKEDVYAFALEIIRLTETYGFDGIDIDLEQHAITFADNASAIPAALKVVKDHYREKQQNFIISMAPEFPYLRDNGSYVAYIKALSGYYDYIAPQFYNQGGDGIWVQEAGNGQGAWLAQNNNTVKADFIYYLCESLCNGTRGFTSLQADKLLIGLPANVDAAATGTVVHPEDVFDAIERLDKAKLAIRGLMVWSVNWDAGKDRNGQAYDWGFTEAYASLNTSPEADAPLPPTALAASVITQTGLMLSWRASLSSGVTLYRVFCNGKQIAEVTAESWKANALQADTAYAFYVVAQNAGGQRSAPSETLNVKTASSHPALPPDGEREWTGDGHMYYVGDRVIYRARRYQCLQKHASIPSWTPNVSASLWVLI